MRRSTSEGTATSGRGSRKSIADDSQLDSEFRVHPTTEVQVFWFSEVGFGTCCALGDIRLNSRDPRPGLEVSVPEASRSFPGITGGTKKMSRDPDKSRELRR